MQISNKQPTTSNCVLDHELLNDDKEIVIERLMDIYGEEIKRLIYTYTNSWTQADDIIQEVFLKIYFNIESFSGEATLRTWIYAIAINKCKDYKRSWYFRNIKLADKIFSFLEANIPSVENEVIKNDERDELMNQVMALPIKYREVILLYYYKDFSVEEISKVTGYNISTVKTRLKRAREKLHLKLNVNRGDTF